MPHACQSTYNHRHIPGGETKTFKKNKENDIDTFKPLAHEVCSPDVLSDGHIDTSLTRDSCDNFASSNLN